MENTQTETVEQPVAETPAVEAEKDITAPAGQPVTEPVADEQPAAAEAPVTEPMAEEAQTPVEVPVSDLETTPEVEPVVEPVAETPAVVEPGIDSDKQTIAELKQLVVTLTASVATLTEMVAKTIPVQSPTEEVSSEADSNVPQAADETEVDVTKELGAPVNRESAVVPEPTPTEPEATTDEPAPVARPKSLREAVKLFAESRNK